MGIPKEIEINNGDNGKKRYYYYKKFDEYNETKHNAKEIKKRHRVSYFILKSQDSWFLPVPVFTLYLSKKLKENGQKKSNII